jgi:hypothetical protein
MVAHALPGQPTKESAPHLLSSFEGKVVGAVAPAELVALTAALRAAGFPTSQVEVVPREELREIAATLDRPGLLGAVGRILLGSELADLKLIRNELVRGDSLVGVPARGEDDMRRAADILRQHGGHGITHFGRWVITALA